MKEKRDLEMNENEAGIAETADKIEEILEDAGLEDVVKATEQDKKEQELKDSREKILRLHADFDNYRKRMQKEKEDWFQYASLSVIEKLLPVIDNLERALESVNQQGQDAKNVYAGVEMTYRQLMDVLQREGLKPIEAKGKIFDPMLHEAIMQVPTAEGQEENQVVEELRKGYHYKDKIIRPSMVKVAKN